MPSPHQGQSSRSRADEKQTEVHAVIYALGKILLTVLGDITNYLQIY